MNVFDRKTKLLHRERAAKVILDSHQALMHHFVQYVSFCLQALDVDTFDFLKEEIGYRLADRVLDIKREMDLGVDIGSGRGYVTRNLTGHSIKRLAAVEMSPTMLEQCQMPDDSEVWILCASSLPHESIKFSVARILSVARCSWTRTPRVFPSRRSP